MESTFWDDLAVAVSSQPVLWGSKEKDRPGTTDKLLRYLITYYENPAVARDAVRTFCGLERNLFAGWSEVRVSSLREIEDTLKLCGAKNHTWELAVTIRDFLQNAYDTIFTIDLDAFKRDGDNAELVAYLKQLNGVGLIFKDSPTPFRPNYSSFNRRQLRVVGEPVLPQVAIDYLKYLWGFKETPPLDLYSQRILTRVGKLDKNATHSVQLKQYREVLTRRRPVSKHRSLISLGKLVCTSEPRCGVCPISQHCASAKH